MAEFELFTNTRRLKLKPYSQPVYFDNSVYLQNVRWFTTIRWMVIIVFILTAVLANFLPETFRELGFRPPLIWLLILAAILTIINTLFCLGVRCLNNDSPRKNIETNLWLQILTDLLFVTVVVHMVGSTHSFIVFIYIFHIVLACIFFNPFGSLMVTLAASTMYIVNIILEILPGSPFSDILPGPALVQPYKTSVIMVFNAGTAVFIWLVTWYLVSTLSRVVREQSEKLSSVNKQLVEVNREKAMQVLVTTHELKAPFSGIESNIQLLKFRYWKDISQPVGEIINKIEARSVTLRKRIDEILILGNLRMKSGIDREVLSVDISKIISPLLISLDDVAKKHHISFSVDVPQKKVVGNTEHLTLLFSNLLTNAIVYSRENGVVQVSAVSYKDGLHIYISDHGIGIREDALPDIFNEYYRTKEGSSFNKASTGLGLSIVKEIATNYSYGIKVQSEINKGTRFEIIIPEK